MLTKNNNKKKKFDGGIMRACVSACACTSVRGCVRVFSKDLIIFPK